MKRRLSAQAAGHAGRSLRASVRCICRRSLSSAAAAKGKFVPPVIPEVDVKEKELVKAEPLLHPEKPGLDMTHLSSANPPQHPTCR